MSFQDSFRQKKVLLTGHTGFKGAWLAIWLEMLGAEVHGLSLDIPSVPSLYKSASVGSLLRHHEGDIRDREMVRKRIKEIQPDFVFHLAAQAIVGTAYREPVETFETNVMGTINVLDALRELEQEVVCVVVTSDKCYENQEWSWGYRENDPLGGRDPYSASKGAAEIAVQAWFRSFFAQEDSSVRLVSGRAGNVIGGGDFGTSRIIPDCVRAWQAGKAVELRSPGAIRPWQHVLEPLSGYLMAAAAVRKKASLNGEAWNFGPHPDRVCSVEVLVRDFATAWSGDLPHPPYEVATRQSFSEPSILKLNWDKAYQDLNWQPVLSHSQTLQLTADWYRAHSGQHPELLEFSRQQIKDFPLSQLD